MGRHRQCEARRAAARVRRLAQPGPSCPAFRQTLARSVAPQSFSVARRRGVQAGPRGVARVAPGCACRAGRLPWRPRRSKVVGGQGSWDQRRCSSASAVAGRGAGPGRRRVSSVGCRHCPRPVGASRSGWSGMLSRGIQSLRGTLRCPGGETCSRCRGLAAAGTIPRPAVVINGYRIGHCG